MADLDLNKLLNLAEQLEIEAGIGLPTSRLPRIERNLSQLCEASKELLSKVGTPGAPDIQKANLLLGSKGIDLPQLSQKIDTLCNSLSNRKTFESLEPIPNIQNFLKNEAENAILSLIENTQRYTSKQVENVRQREMFYSWENEKRKLLNSFVGHSGSVVELPMSHEYTSINETQITQCPMDQNEMAYSQALKDYNHAVLAGDFTPNLVEKLADAIASFHDSNVNDLWSMVKYMSELSPSNLAQDNESFPRATPQIQQEMISQARKYLEKCYQLYMNIKVSQSLSEVRRGVPGTYSLVCSFLQIQISSGAISSLGLEDINIGGLPYWPLIYYLLRCGDIESAVTATKTLLPNLNDFYAVLLDLKQNGGKLSNKVEKTVKRQYKSYVRNVSDPFKRVVYSALGACSIGDYHSEVIVTADDFLWLKLLQVRPAPEGVILRDSHASSTADVLPYDLLQTIIIEEYGESYYDAATNPYLYFQVLFLTGQFEAAIEFLVRNPKLRSHGVHIAIALLKSGLLALTGSSDAPLVAIESHDPPPNRRLNICRVITLYTNKFEILAAQEALHYYFVLRDTHSSGPSYNNMFAECVAALALQTRDFGAIFGCLDAEGCITPGLIHEFGNRESDIRQIINYTAERSEQKGEFEDARYLYELGGNLEKALCLMNRSLSECMARPNEVGSVRARIQSQAKEMCARIQGQNIGADPNTVRTFHILTDLFEFFDLYSNEQYQVALQIIQRSELIPFTLAEVDEKITKFKRLDEGITRNMADILLATMNMIHSEFQKLKNEDNLPGSSTDEIRKKRTFLKERARALTTFSALIPFHIPKDVNSKLLQIEIHML